jgi:hypothetical protein
MLNPNELSSDECDDIAQYKEYQQRHLPDVGSLKDLYASDFDAGAYSEDEVDGLKQYLDTLRSYTRHVKRAAYLRQAHYDLWIKGKKEEESGHAAWREGMNAIAKDCEEKLEYWSRVYDEKLTKVFDAASLLKPLRTCDIDFTVRNCDLSFYREDNKRVKLSTKRSKIYYPPKVSAKERARLNAQYRAQLLAKNLQEHKMLDQEMSKVSAYHQLIESYSPHKISNAIEVPTLDIYDELIKYGIDNPLTCNKFSLSFNCGIIPIGTEEEMVDLSLLLYTSISQINSQFCTYYKCIGVDTCDNSVSDERLLSTYVGNSTQSTVGECKHACDKCEIGEVVPEALQSCCHKLDHLVHLINFILQLNPQAEVVILTLLNCLLTDQRTAWNSYPNGVIMSMILAKMDDDAIIANITISAKKLVKIRESIRTISKMDISIDVASAAIKTAMGYYKRLNQYMAVLTQLYPASLYYDRITFMKRLIEENDVVYGSKLVRNGRLFIDPPVVAYHKIKRETGVIMNVQKYILAEYESVRKQYGAKLKGALIKLDGRNNEHERKNDK